jgi:hypothetical protein
MTHLECGKIVPAVSTTTAIITGYLLTEMLKYQMGVESHEDLHEYQVNLSVPSILKNMLEPAKFRQNNGDLSSDFEFLIPKTKSPTDNGSMSESGLWNAWHKEPISGCITIKELYDFVTEEYG